MSNAEARSWWADVQHLRPDAPTASAVLDVPGAAEVDAARADRLDARAVKLDAPAPAGRDAHLPGAEDPLLAPAPGRRFVRAPAAAGPSRRKDPDDVMQAPAGRDGSTRRRIVLLREDAEHAAGLPTDGEAGAAAATRTATVKDGARPASAPRDGAGSAAPAGTDVDFDFGRAAEARARRRTAERLGVATDGEAGTPKPTGGPLDVRADAPIAAFAPPRARGGALSPRRGASVPAGRRPRRSRREHIASDPDRIALWAVVLGILLVALAAATSRADAATHRPAPLERAVPAPASGLADAAGTAATD